MHAIGFDEMANVDWLFRFTQQVGLRGLLAYSRDPQAA
jgi:hypothetical protein